MKITKSAAIASALMFIGAPAFAQTPSAPRTAAAWGCQAVTPSPATLPGAQSQTYRTASGRDLRAHVFSPTDAGKPRPAVLFFFGGGWRVGNVSVFADRARAFAEQGGYVAIVADYRVSCRDNTTVPDSVADAAAAFAWVRAHARDLNIDPKRIVLSGGSAGGHLALMATLHAAANEKPVAMVLYNPAVDLSAVAPVLAIDDKTARALSPALLPATGLPPMVIFHGEADKTVPIAGVRAYCDQVKSAGGSCDLKTYAGQDHGFFQRHEVTPEIGISPYDDTLARSLAFLKARGISNRP